MGPHGTEADTRSAFSEAGMYDALCVCKLAQCDARGGLSSLPGRSSSPEGVALSPLSSTQAA